MSINMFLPNARSQAEAIQAMCQTHIEGFEAVKRAIVQFIATPELKGVTYDSAKKYFSETYLPLTNGMILAAEALQRAAKQFPQKYVSEVDSNSLQEAKLRMQMQRLEQLARFAENMDDMAKSTPLSPLFEKLAGSYRQQKQKIHEKLEKLMVFNGTSLLIFIEAEQLFASIEAGLREVSGGKGFHTSTKSFSTMGMKMGWAAPIEKAQKAKDKRLENEALKQYETMPVPNVPAGMNRGFETNPDGTLDIQGTMDLAEANRQLVMEGNTGDIIDLIDPTQDVLRFFTGKDPLTDVKLSKTERGMALLFIFPFVKVGKSFKFAFRGVEDVERLGKFGKTASKFSFDIKDIDTFKNVELKTVENYLDKNLKEYTKAPLKKGSGVRYFDGKGNSWQLNYGYKNATDTIHSGAYLKTTINGKIIRVSLKMTNIKE